MGKTRSKRYVDPMASLDGNNLPFEMGTVDSKYLSKLPKNSNLSIGDTGSSTYTGNEYEVSRFDDNNMFKEDLPFLEQIRAENQGIIPTLGSALGRVVLNIIPTVIGNTASILDFEDYNNQDNEVGNAVTRAMEEFKASVNKDFLPIYRKDSNKSFDIGDSAWWLENGSSLAESIGAFALTGAGIGAAFNVAGKGLSMINGLSKLGQAGKTAATVLSSAGLNQAESITTAMQVFDSIKKQGGSDENAAEAASYSININRANIALNLTSAGAFIRSPKATRQIREAFNNSKSQILNEGGQEYLEETINYVAQQEGERFGKSAVDGKKYKFDFKNVVNDALSVKGIEAGVLGFLGGAGQTGLTRVYNRMNGQAVKQDQLYNAQQESLFKIKQLQDADIVPNVTDVFNSIEKSSQIQNQISEAFSSNNDQEAKRLQYQLLNNQITDSLQNGTVEQLENVYTDLLELDSQTAETKGLDIDPSSPYYYKKKAQEAISLLNDVEDSYLSIASKNYLNGDKILNADIQSKSLNRLSSELNKDYAKTRTNLLQEALNVGVIGDIDFSNPSEDIKNLPSYNKYVADTNILELVQNELKQVNKKIKELSSSEYQTQLKNKQQEEINKQLAEEQEVLKIQKEQELKESQQKSKEKVEAAQIKKNEIAEPEIQESNFPTLEDEVNPFAGTSGEFIEKEIELNSNLITEEEKASIKDELSVELAEASKILEEAKANEDQETAELALSTIDNIIQQLNEIENEVTEGDIVVAKILNTEEKIENNLAIINDGLVKNHTSVDKIKKELKYSDETSKRSIGNVIISLNVDYIETILGNTSNSTNEKIILDTYDENGKLNIIDNFDSRLQDPNQFNAGTKLNIILPTYAQIVEKGISGKGYTLSNYTNDLSSYETTPIAFVDNSNRIVGYLPTTQNVKNRVNKEQLEIQLNSNKELRNFILENRNSDMTVTITQKSSGTPLFGIKSNSIYKALGNNESLSEGVEIAIVKDGKIMIDLNKQSSKVIKNNLELEDGVVYSITPTADGITSHIIPMDIKNINTGQAKTILKLIQLFKANDKFERDSDLIKERLDISNEIDLNNIKELTNALEQIIYINNENDKFVLKLTKEKLALGITPDKVFTWNDVMTNADTQQAIVDILSKRFASVKLANFGKLYQEITLTSTNKIKFIRHDNYFDYINAKGIVTTNLQGESIENSDKKYFTAQSVIEFSNPIIESKALPQQEVNEKVVVIEEIVEEGAEMITDVVAPTVVEEVYKPKPKNSMGSKYRPGKSTNKNKLEEDFDVFDNTENLTLDEQAEELMKKCNK